MFFVTTLRLALSLFLEFNNNGSSTNRESSWSPVSSTIMYVHPNAFILSTGCFTTCPRLFSDILWIVWKHSPKCLTTFAGMFGDISRNVWRHSPECFGTFPGMFWDIPRNVWGHSPEYLMTFPGIFGDIPRNVWRHSPKCLATFPRMFEDIPRNVWGHSTECLVTFPRMFGNILRNIKSPYSPCSPHSVPLPVFLVLYIALRHGCSPVNLRHIFRTPFLKNTSGRLRLKSDFALKNNWWYVKL